MKFQILYECPDLDFQGSYEKLVQSNLVTAEVTEKGLLWVHFKKFKVLFLISPEGKIQVKWENPKQKEILVKILSTLLVSTTGNDVVLHPKKQNLTVEYPAPKEIELWWCEEKDLYIHQDEAKSIMDLPEFKEADWSKISDKAKNSLFILSKMADMAGERDLPRTHDLLYDFTRYLLMTRALEKDSKPFSKKIKEAFTS